MRDLSEALELDEQNEDEQIITVGDDILSQFYYGNYSDAIKMMITDGVEAAQLATYFEDMCEELGTEIYANHFTPTLWAHIGGSIEQEKR